MIERRALSVLEFSQALGISRNHVYALVRRGALRVIRLGRRILIPSESLEELLRARSTARPK